LKINLQSVRVAIEGTLAGDGKSIGGTWSQFGVDRQPVELVREGSPTPLTFFDPIVEIRIPIGCSVLLSTLPKRVPGSGDFERGDPRQLASSPSYGAEVLAVGDARVTMVRDGLADVAAYEIAPPYAITKDTLGGNLAVLDLGQGHWAVYAHLQPGSFRVKQGDRVRKGDVIARLGNSTSYSPHLHFQVVDGPEPFSSEGVPFVFDEFTHEGVVRRDEMPAGDWNITFGDRPRP